MSLLFQRQGEAATGVERAGPGVVRAWEPGAAGQQGGTHGAGRAQAVGLTWWEVKEGL